MLLIRRKSTHTREAIADYKDELGNDEWTAAEKKNPKNRLVMAWNVFKQLLPGTKSLKL